MNCNWIIKRATVSKVIKMNNILFTVIYSNNLLWYNEKFIYYVLLIYMLAPIYFWNYDILIIKLIVYIINKINKINLLKKFAVNKVLSKNDQEQKSCQ